MHIPNEMLSNTVSQASAVLAVVGLVVATKMARSAADKPDVFRFAAVTAFIFAGQMLNFPVSAGTSGHILGGVLSAVLLGAPFGILSLAVVIVLQTLIFADGGVLALGANLLNMAFIGAGMGGFLYSLLQRSVVPSWLACALAAWVSCMSSTLFCSVELAMSGTVPLSQVLPAMISVHALIGLGEAAMTLAAVTIFGATAKHSVCWQIALPILAAILVTVVLLPHSSSSPDGLEWVAGQLDILHESAPLFISPLADYRVSGISNSSMSNTVAGLIGIALTFVIAALLPRGFLSTK